MLLNFVVELIVVLLCDIQYRKCKKVTLSRAQDRLQWHVAKVHKYPMPPRGPSLGAWSTYALLHAAMKLYTAKLCTLRHECTKQTVESLPILYYAT